MAGSFDVKIVKAAPGPAPTSWVNQFGTICLCLLSGGGVYVNTGISGERAKSRGGARVRKSSGETGFSSGAP